MNRKQITIGFVGLVIGFILGFFVASGTQSRNIPSSTGSAQSEGGLPENHPSPEQMEQVEALVARAKADPADREARVSLGNVYYDMGRFDAAIPWYEEALQMSASDVLVSTDLGTAYLYTGEIEKAIDQYQKSLVIQPNHPQTMQNMGIAYFSAERYADAIDVWERLIKTNPDYGHLEDIKNQIAAAQQHLEAKPATK